MEITGSISMWVDKTGNGTGKKRKTSIMESISRDISIFPAAFPDTYAGRPDTTLG
jgi:hypothetical protein